MSWKPGDYAVLQIFGTPDLDGEVVKLCSKVGDYHYAPNKFVPDAWWVQVLRMGEFDKRIMSEYVFTPVSHPNKKKAWSDTDCPFRPLEYVKYP